MTTPKKALQAVFVKDFEPSEVLNTHRPRLAAVEQKWPTMEPGVTIDLH